MSIHGVSPISNATLKPGDIPPDATACERVIRFAQAFNAYEALGIEECGRLGNDHAQCHTLTQLRAAVFFEYRRYNHLGWRPEPAKVAEVSQLLDRIRAKLAAGEIA